MSKIISILGVVAAIAFAIAPSFSDLNPTTAGWLMLIGTLASASSQAISTKSDNIAVTILGVIMAVAAVIAGATDLLPAQATFLAGIIGTAVAAAGRSLFSSPPDQMNSSIIPVLLAFLLLVPASAPNCSSAKEYPKALNRAAGYTQTALDIVDYELTNKTITPETARQLVLVLQKVNGINRELTTESAKYVQGNTFVLPVEGQDKLSQLVVSGQTILTGVLSSPEFSTLTPESRQRMKLTIDSLINTFQTINAIIVNSRRIDG